ncbi:hypothetical protein [Neptuniibacter pectenicola]|uniref:hypothetical protein n=1 Tax=Neptuniibacter pectenicola TaxID=1806669 RepID=UPI0030EB73FF|tara:strand:- start:6595 stop:8217 length:1623 start_codon:yes stop_codon:yes gene_type:complete
MHRNIKYSEGDYYLSYLNISLHNESPMCLCGGRFASYLEKKFGIKELPYDIKLIDLILNGDNTDELFVELPKEYFRGERVKESSSDFVKNAAFHDVYITSHDDSGLRDFIHPYETSLNKSFKEKYKTNHPVNLADYEDSNGHKFRPYESYMAYWRAYVIFETVQNCKFIDLYLDKVNGIDVFKRKYNQVNKLWVDKYSSSFNRLALFRSFITRVQMSNNTIKFTYSDISNFLLDHCDSSILDLKSDMTTLLEIHHNWKDNFKRSGLAAYESALNLLKKDIYFLFEWLCYAGMKEDEVIEAWAYKDRQMQSWSQLKDVLDFEEIKFFESFKQYVPCYSENIKDWLSCYELPTIYDYLKSLDSFSPWIRGFYDLHALINEKDDIRLVQSRVIDNLLILSIRTEIIIREVYSSLSGTQEPDLLKKLFIELPELVSDSKSTSVFKAIVDKENWRLTELKDRPENIFAKVDACNVGKNWSKDQKYFFKQLLKFVTSRNYFAHHSYQDAELNNHITELCRNVFVSCLHSVLYITALSTRNQVSVKL